MARNVMVVNMYGTTETQVRFSIMHWYRWSQLSLQRAVSYHALPPLSADPGFMSTQKEVIPAGKGMKDVQLLVVNRLVSSLSFFIFGSQNLLSHALPTPPSTIFQERQIHSLRRRRSRRDIRSKWRFGGRLPSTSQISSKRRARYE